MELTDDELKALERYRTPAGNALDATTLALAMLRLFPVSTYGTEIIRWSDPITPERLVACGFCLSDFCVTYCGLAFYPLEGRWWSDGTVIPSGVAPRKMLDIWNLMARCGIKESGE